MELFPKNLKYYKKSLKIPKSYSKSVNQRRTDNTMAKRRTDNTMAKRRTDNTMAKRRTDNTMAKRKAMIYKTSLKICIIISSILGLSCSNSPISIYGF